MTCWTAEEFVTTRRSPLKEGDFMPLRNCPLRRYVLRTHCANANYPDREIIQKLAYLLAPSKIIVDTEQPRIDI